MWLTKEEEEGYYHGLANEGLWPLCHITFTRPVFQLKDWETYRKVNALFGDAVLEEADDRPTFVFIQDYHFALLPRYLKERNPNLIVAQFWHIPWPNRETFRVFPWKEELLDGLLGNDLLGFHLRYHCQNFIETVDRTIEARIDHEQSEIVRNNKSTLVRPFPISIDFERQAALAVEHRGRAGNQEAAAAAPPAGRHDRHRHRADRLHQGNPGTAAGARSFLRALPGVSRAADLHPGRRPQPGHIPSVPADRRGDRLPGRANQLEMEHVQVAPVIYFKRHFSMVEMTALHRMADFCIVSSLHDGMNLVAKEFVASRMDEDGVLLLSQFAGSALELTDAVLFNPFAIDEMAEAIHQAVEMPPAERKKRMQRMRSAVQDNNVYRWAGKILSALLKFDIPEVAVNGPEPAKRPTAQRCRP